MPRHDVNKPICFRLFSCRGGAVAIAAPSLSFHPLRRPAFRLRGAAFLICYAMQLFEDKPRDELSCSVRVDAITTELAAAFDYPFTGRSTFEPPEMPPVPEDFGIGLIVGPSGSGKSTLLRRFGSETAVDWNPNLAVCSHFQDADDARARLSGVGFNSIPAWMRPYHVLSTGERFRADLARRLQVGAVVDEFTSVVDRTVAKSCAASIRRYVDAQRLSRVVFASCHYDVAEWLLPDWTFDTLNGRLTVGRLERRPTVVLRVQPCTAAAWSVFRNHHYLSGHVNRNARCWIATWDGTPVGFAASVAFPCGTVRNAWRGHRTVVLPDYQGMGFGVRISDAVGEMFVREGCRYFSKTAHPRMGAYRDGSPLWRPTSKNGKARPDYRADRQTKESAHKMRHAARRCYSHEYIGTNAVPDLSEIRSYLSKST